MGDHAKKAELDARKAKVKKTLQEDSEKKKKKKKGFMTAATKKRIRGLIRKKAAKLFEEEKARMSVEKLEALNERCGEQKNLENLSLEDLVTVIKQYHQRFFLNESQKWDLEFEVRRCDLKIHELNLNVNNLKGKFQMPVLKKVSLYENKFARLQKKDVKFNFKVQLKKCVGK